VSADISQGGSRLVDLQPFASLAMLRVIMFRWFGVKETLTL